MTWTFTSTDPGATTRDQIRLWIGDTDTTEQQLSDESISLAYTFAGSSILSGAVVGCEWLAAKYSRLADSSVSDLSISYSQLADHYATLGASLKRRIGNDFSPSAGGISIARVQSVNEDTDRVSPAFVRGMMDNPTASESFTDQEES
jgi:hypothetical protein